MLGWHQNIGVQSKNYGLLQPLGPPLLDKLFCAKKIGLAVKGL